MRSNSKSCLIGVVMVVSITSLARDWSAHSWSGTPATELIGTAATSQQARPHYQGGYGTYTFRQSLIRKAGQEKNSQEVMSPLTDEERSLNPRDLILNQPDFSAELTFFRSEQVSGGGGSEFIARKGNRYREESQFWVFIGESGMPAARVFTEAKTYFELEPPRYESVNTSEPFNPKTLALEVGVTYTALGAVMIDGYRCIKIEAIRRERPKKVYLFAARDLRNLIIVARVLDPPRSFVQRLANVSLEVPDSLIEIPRDYKPIERDRWTKVETAKVAYKGKPSRNYGVFRSPGGELFVWINDAPYPWHYLVRPQEAIVETAFQGLLVTRSGAYVWRTGETEAFSRTSYRDRNYRDKKRSANTSVEGKHVIVSQNSVEFPSNDYDRDRALIKITW